MLSMILFAALQAAPIATAAAAEAPAPAEAPAAAPEEEAAEPQVQKPRKVCRMVADPRVSALASRRKVCREVFDQDNG